MTAFLVAAAMSAAATPRPIPAHAPSTRPTPPPSTIVRQYFSDVERGDFAGALRLTTGDAAVATHKLADEIARAARQNDARVEVKVRRLDVRTVGFTRRAAVVDADFHFDVVGHKWIFSKVGRRVDGKAHFFVAGAGQRIVKIDGNLD